jgi:hypothetical protein
MLTKHILVWNNYINKRGVRRALWARHVFVRQRPGIDFVPDPRDEAVSRTIHSNRKNEPITKPRDRTAGIRAKKIVKKTRITYLKRRTILKERE